MMSYLKNSEQRDQNKFLAWENQKQKSREDARASLKSMRIGDATYTTDYILIGVQTEDPGFVTDEFFIDNMSFSVLEGLDILCDILGIEKAYIFFQSKKLFEKFRSKIKSWESSLPIGRKPLDICSDVLHSSYLASYTQSMEAWVSNRSSIPLRRETSSIRCSFGDCLKVYKYFLDGPSNFQNTKILSLFSEKIQSLIVEVMLDEKIDAVLSFHGLHGVKAVLLNNRILLPAASFQLTFNELQDDIGQMSVQKIEIIKKNQCIVKKLFQWIEFYSANSCGKCKPCFEASYWNLEILKKILSIDAKIQDLDLLLDIAKNMGNYNLCNLASDESELLLSTILYFRDEFEFYIREGHSLYEAGSH